MKKSNIILIVMLNLPIVAHCQKVFSHIFNPSTVVNTKAVLFDEIAFNSSELLSTNFQFTNKDNTQKAIIKPFAFSNGNSSFLRDTKINLAQKDGITTFGLGITYDQMAAYNKKRMNKILGGANIPAFHCNPGESEENCEKRKKLFLENLSSAIVTEILKKRIKNSFSITAGYNISLFGIVGGDKILNSDSMISNDYIIKAHNFSIDLTYSFSEKCGINIGSTYQRKRKSSVENEKMINYYGLNFTLSHWLFALDADYKESSDYLKNLFASSVYGGVSFEYLKADGDSKYFEDGIKYQFIMTPFIDFRISPKSQFRLGLPIKKYNTVNKNQLGLGPFLQYSLQLSDKS